MAMTARVAGVGPSFEEPQFGSRDSHRPGSSVGEEEKEEGEVIKRGFSGHSAAGVRSRKGRKKGRKGGRK